MSKIKALVLTGYGLNCDHETAYALELAGACAVRVHINDLIDRRARLLDFQILVFGGGFSWGDDHGAGVIQAVRLKTNIGADILEFIAKGNLALGICNGFQTLVNLGLLPGFDHDYQTRSVALVHNDCGNFRNDWVRLKANACSPCIFTRGLDAFELPIRHGEGKFYADQPVLDRLEQNQQVVLRYALKDGSPAQGQFPFNPNGSVRDIAGICDATGRVFGLMPHPEAYNNWTNHPDWTLHKRLGQHRGLASEPTAGIRIFQNAVQFLKNG